MAFLCGGQTQAAEPAAEPSAPAAENDSDARGSSDARSSGDDVRSEKSDEIKDAVMEYDVK
eukprot:5765699-Heterocapsa_arctica.AAC.1